MADAAVQHPADRAAGHPGGSSFVLRKFGSMAESEWWQTVITGNDQLRQRVAFALSQLFVISTDTVTGWDVQSYMNTLAQMPFRIGTRS